MKNGILKRFLSIALLLFISSPVMAFARHGQQRCQMDHCPEKTILCEYHLAIAKPDDLKLSNDQVSKILKLKTDTKKELIKMKADIDLVNIDIK